MPLEITAMSVHEGILGKQTSLTGAMFVYTTYKKTLNFTQPKSQDQLTYKTSHTNWLGA